MRTAPHSGSGSALARRARRFVPVAAAGLLLLVGLALLAQGLWIPIKAQAAQFLLARAWERSMAGYPAPPGPGADTTAVAKLSLAGKSFVVLGGGSGQALAFAPSHLPGTPLPGEPGLSVIAAHRDTHFSALGELAPGRVVRVRRPDGRLYRFRIAGGRIMDVRAARLVDRDGPPRLALVTCWPLNSPVPGGPLRLVLFADAIAAAPVSSQIEAMDTESS